MKFNKETIEINAEEFTKIATVVASAYVTLHEDKIDGDEFIATFSEYVSGLTTSLFTQRLAEDFIKIAEEEDKKQSEYREEGNNENNN